MKVLIGLIWTDKSLAIRAMRSLAIFGALLVQGGVPESMNEWLAKGGVSLLGMVTGDDSKSGIPKKKTN